MSRSPTGGSGGSVSLRPVGRRQPGPGPGSPGRLGRPPPGQLDSHCDLTGRLPGPGRWPPSGLKCTVLRSQTRTRNRARHGTVPPLRHGPLRRLRRRACRGRGGAGLGGPGLGLAWLPTGTGSAGHARLRRPVRRRPRTAGSGSDSSEGSLYCRPLTPPGPTLT